MPKLIKIENSTSYATRANAIKAVEKKYADRKDVENIRYFIHTLENGRFIPVFVGQAAATAGIHFDFNVIA